jgi:hypothetical protein
LTIFFHNIFPWNSMENSMEFYESEVDGIPWNSMEIRQLTEFDDNRF